ncbi:hypothetical protein F7Q99_27025 [Streptomyces kaniharaensis]|uniref:Uncharacterized protein n=1 Tax=Streptomyces kaniharaensis TaxID=212423 RepID=A0A6N7KWJ3_9ACTN|nr:hypothetical protein [Streptomyces kaniharaensis]MQS15821.1 hypothetical protein [Streptomyces kaniharaensis]
MTPFPDPTPSSARWAPRLDRAALRAVGAALALAAAGVGDGGSGTAVDRFGPAASVAAAAFALWASPPSEGGAPTATLPAGLTATRTTALATGSVLLAALGEPAPWRALVVTVLLTGYLLLLDALDPRHRPRRPASAAAATLASLLVLPAAFAPTAALAWSRPVALLGLAAAACGTGLALCPPGAPSSPDPPSPSDEPAQGDAARH